MQADFPDSLDALPIFPLPGTVLFPGTVLPLHIFEHRYRNMVADVLEGESLMAIALVKPGLDFTGSPPVHEVAGCGRIIHADRLSDGRYNILLQGLERVRLESEVSGDKPYRRFSATVIPRPGPHDLRRAEAELAKLQSCVISLQTMIGDNDAPLLEVLRSTADPIELSDILAASLVQGTEVQQRVLAEAELGARLALLIDELAEVMLRVGAPATTQQPN